MAQAVCSECPASLDGKPPGTYTCSQACKSKRQRRMRRERKEADERRKIERKARDAGVKDMFNEEAKDVARDVMREELRPVVRAQMTTQLLAGLQRMTNLVPTAIDRMVGDLDSDDELVRQRAYTLLLRYTMGNPSVAPPPQDPAAGGVTVQFALPRAEPAPIPAALPETPGPIDDAVEVRTCYDCKETKPVTEFVGQSERCVTCFDGMRDLLRQRFGDAYRG